jgi:3D (Asp-Asp-Asp) domain-containing protein
MNKTSQSKNIEDNSRKKRLRFIVAFLIVFIICLIPCYKHQLIYSNNKSLLSMNSDEIQIEITDKNTYSLENAINKYVISDSGLNIRNKNWEIISALPLNSAITVLQEQVTEDKEYDLILYNDEYAYANNKYLSLQKKVVKKNITKDNKSINVISQKNNVKVQNNSSEEIQNITQDNYSEDISNNWVYLGTFSSTAYCPCSKCCGKWAGGPTASGKMPKSGRTIAVDPSVIPLGTQVKVNGNIYVAEDTGSAIKGKKIDIYFDSHSDALNWGRRSVEIYILK